MWTELVANCSARAACRATDTAKRGAALGAKSIIRAVQAAALGALDGAGWCSPAPQAPDLAFDEVFSHRAMPIFASRGFKPIQFLQNGYGFGFRFRTHGSIVRFGQFAHGIIEFQVLDGGI